MRLITHLAGAAMAVCLVPVMAFAGPCSDDIAAIGKQLSQSPAMGPATTGALAGSGPGVIGHGPSGVADPHGTSADSKIGGLAGTREVNAASANVATSDADVRAQQLGKPTAAQAKPGTVSDAADGRMTRAKAAWQKAVDLNAQNDSGCQGAVQEARQMLK